MKLKQISSQGFKSWHRSGKKGSHQKISKFLHQGESMQQFMMHFTQKEEEEDQHPLNHKSVFSKHSATDDLWSQKVLKRVWS